MDLETLAVLLKRKESVLEGLFAKVRAEWETLTALGTLVPYAPTLRPNRFKASPKILGQK